MGMNYFHLACVYKARPQSGKLKQKLFSQCVQVIDLLWKTNKEKPGLLLALKAWEAVNLCVLFAFPANIHRQTGNAVESAAFPQPNSLTHSVTVVLSRDILSRCVWSHFLPGFLRLTSVILPFWKQHVPGLQFCTSPVSWSLAFGYHTLQCAFMSRLAPRREATRNNCSLDSFL